MSARNKVTLLLLALLYFLQGISQKNDIIINHPDRYRLELPKEWNRHKLIEAITDILPQTIDELKDREFCTEGKAAFYVRLFMDSLSVNNIQTSPPVEIGSIPHYTFSFNYSFYAALLVTDSLEKPVSLLQLISGEEIMNYSKQFSLRPQNVVYRYQSIYDSRGRMVGRRLVEEARAVNNYVPKISASSVLTESFLLNICEQRIFEIRKLLKKMNPG
jgi:hypothetical protein